MWRMMPQLATATLFAAILSNQASASAVQSYMYYTSGSIAGTSGNGYGYPITFSPQSNISMMTTPGTFALGTITTSPLVAGSTLTYDNTPFAIDVTVGAVSPNTYNNYGYNYYGYYGNNYFTPAYTYQISGVLNGALKGDGTSTLFPTVTSVTGVGSTPPFPASDLKFDLQGIAAPVGTTFGSTLLTARVDITGNPLPSPAPEPTSVAVFAAALAGWVWKRRKNALPTASV